MGLQGDQFGDRITPALGSATLVCCAVAAADGLAGGLSRSVAGWRSASVIGLSPIGLRGMLHSEP